MSRREGVCAGELDRRAIEAPYRSRYRSGESYERSASASYESNSAVAGR